MKKTLLLLCLLPLLSSCGATGKLIGTVVRLPVDIARSATMGYQEDQNVTQVDFEAMHAAPIHHSAQ